MIAKKHLEENLSVTHYRNGDEIPEVTDPVEWAGLTTGAWCYYKNDAANGETYGMLYNWYAVNDPRGLAPTGYHIPTDAEWNNIKPDYLPGGLRNNDGTFTNIGYYGNWWSSTETNAASAWYRGLDYSSSNVYRGINGKRFGFSVRCVADVELTEPLEKPKQETLEEFIKKSYLSRLEDDLSVGFGDGIKLGAKWQEERMYSEEEVFEILYKSHNAESPSIIANTLKKWFEFKPWFEQFKKK